MSRVKVNQKQQPTYSVRTIPNTYNGMIEMMIAELLEIEAEKARNNKANMYVSDESDEFDPDNFVSSTHTSDKLDVGDNVIAVFSENTAKRGTINTIVGWDAEIEFEDGTKSIRDISTISKID